MADFKKHFTGHGKTNVKVCDVIVYPGHFAIVVGFDVDGTPLTVGQNGSPSKKPSVVTGDGDTPDKPSRTGNITINTVDTFENTGTQETDWEAYSPNEPNDPATGKPPDLPQGIKDKSADAEKERPTRDAKGDLKPMSEPGKKKWLAIWLACRERNYAMMGVDATGKKESLTISRREIVQPPNAPQYVAVPPAAPSGGQYVGVEGGWRGSNVNVTTTDTTTLGGGDPVRDNSASVNNGSPQGGVYVGYSTALSPNFVGQAEFGGGYGNNNKTVAGIPGTAGIPVGGIAARIPNDSTSVKTTWDLHLLARLGLKVTPNTNVFLTGGGGLLHSETTVNCTAAGVCGGIGVPPFTATHSSTRRGWIVGAGIETVLTRGWRTRLEYRHADYGTDSALYGNPTLLAVNAGTKLTTDQVMLGFSYQFGAPLVLDRPRPAYSGPPMVVKAPALK